jgi:hypothetical protein
MKELLFNIGQALLPVFIAFCTFVSPIAGVLSAVGVFIAADAIFARYRCYTLKVKWTSRKFRAGLIPKVITYNVFVLSFFMLDKFVINDFISLFTTIPYALTKLLAMVLIYVELKSIDESFEAINKKSLFKYLIEILVHVKRVNKQIENINIDKDKKPADGDQAGE